MTTSSRMLFLNLPVRDLPRTVDYFTKLGFGFNPQFTNDDAACMIVSEQAFVMLLVEKRFKDFTERQICDTASRTEGIFALSAPSRAEVDALADKALALGGKPAMPPMDHGFMYGRSFYDLDGHHWEVIWMDMSQVPPTP